MRVVGLTGGVASGKSTVARLLGQRWGFPVVDADQIARQVLAPGSAGLAALVEALGPSILTPDGSLDRPALRARLVREPDVKRTLDAVSHPRIGAAIADRLTELRAGGASVVFVEAALMVETGSYRAYDALWVVTAPVDVQVARLAARDGGDADAARRLVAVQMPTAEKAAVADVVIRNDGDSAALEQAVADAVLTLAAPPTRRTASGSGGGSDRRGPA